jgi:hypothetical protein
VRCQIDGGGHEFLRQRSEACHKRQRMDKQLATPAEGFTFRNFLTDVFTVFMFVFTVRLQEGERWLVQRRHILQQEVVVDHDVHYDPH